MAHVEKSIELNVPVRTAYNQWTQFETFPQFMDGVEEVKQLDAERLFWRAKVGGKTKEWDARITEQVPDQKIAWHSTSGPENGGAVYFHSMGDSACRITLHLSYDPEGVVENAGDALGFVQRQVEGDLDRFRSFIMDRGQETGAWRGEIAAGSTR